MIVSWVKCWGMPLDIVWMSTLKSSQYPYHLVDKGHTSAGIATFNTTWNSATLLQRPALMGKEKTRKFPFSLIY